MTTHEINGETAGGSVAAVAPPALAGAEEFSGGVIEDDGWVDDPDIERQRRELVAAAAAVAASSTDLLSSAGEPPPVAAVGLRVGDPVVVADGEFKGTALSWGPGFDLVGQMAAAQGPEALALFERFKGQLPKTFPKVNR